MSDGHKRNRLGDEVTNYIVSPKPCDGAETSLVAENVSFPHGPSSAGSRNDRPARKIRRLAAESFETGRANREQQTGTEM